MNTTSHQSPVEIAPSTNVFEWMEWDGLGHDMDEDDIITHMAFNGTTQSMVDSAYLYGLTFIDRGLSTDSAHAEFYLEVDQQRHILLDMYGIPPTIDAHQGWWYPDAQDLERIHVLRHVQSYEAMDKRVYNAGITSIRPIYDWFHVGEHYVYEWLAERPPPNDVYTNNSVSGSSPTPHPNISINEDVEMDNRVAGNIPTMEISSALAGDCQDGVTTERNSNAAESMDAGITHAGNHASTSETVVPDKEMPEDKS
ncbi:hypothetical protein IW262DRAFT_1455276 [Armillaria fumosa]|nr:hypothetical protein IW262DRAFT_1455276 [Armillaria fumosa]